MKILRCPLCHSDLKLENHAYVCDHNHTFNLSKKNAINFVNTNRKSPYDAEFFESRHRVLNAGYFDGIVEMVSRHITGSVILDLGSGEGTLTKMIQDNFSDSDVYGLDYAKEGIARSVKGEKSGVMWLVGDISNLPFKDHSADVILNIFSPANYDEFKRVLKPDGLLIKVIPLNHHFKELRREDKPLDLSVVHLLDQHFEIEATVNFEETYPVLKHLEEDIQKMSPIHFGKAVMLETKEITIHALMVVSKNKGLV